MLVEVPENDMHALVGEIATWLTERGLPFVTEEIDGRIVIRPPRPRSGRRASAAR